jgi:epoxyqueuosine reductase
MTTKPYLHIHPMSESVGVDVRETIRARGRDIGFDRIGFAPGKLPEQTTQLREWLDRGYHGEMGWMTRDPARRTDANRSLPRAATLVCCALNYYQGPREPPTSLEGVISTYAQGEDYHRILGRKLRTLADFISERFDLPSKIYVDTGPVLEKGYAVAAGLGWLGKHSNLISRPGSSWFFLGEILLPIALPPDEREKDHCGTCSKCITACPTGAIVEPYVVDSRLCISYLTIELRGFIPRELRTFVGNRIYGCDDCQDVCPWNRFATKSEEASFFPREPLASMDLITMLRMSREEYLAATRQSTIRRARYAGLLRNVAIALGNSGDPRAVPALVEALDHPEPLVRGHAAWALSRLGRPAAVTPLRGRLVREEQEEVREEIRGAISELGGGVSTRSTDVEP